MSAPNKATEMIAEFALGYWSSTDHVPDADDIEDVLYGMAHSILACDGEVYHPDNEPFPEWTTLVMTPAIANTIDYKWCVEHLHRHIAGEEDWTCDDCGEDCGDELGTIAGEPGKWCATCFKNH